MLAKLAYFWTHVEILNNRHIYVMTERYTPVMRLLPLGFWLVGPLGLLGLAACWGRGRELFPLWGFVVVYMSSVVIFFVNSRFRVPVLPLLILLGAYGVAELARAVGSRRWSRVVALCGALLLGIVLVIPAPAGAVTSDAEALERLGAAQFINGRHHEAIDHFEEAIAADPDHLRSFYSLGQAYEEIGQLAQAARAYERLLERDPNHLAALQRSSGLALHEGRESDAADLLSRVLRVNEDDISALLQLGYLRAMARDPSLRDCTEARRASERAVRLTSRSDELALDALAGAYAECGEFDRAVEVANEALELARRKGERTTAMRIDGRLRQYRARQSPADQR